MKIKSEPSSKIIISRRCTLTALLVLHVIIVLILAPIYGRLLLAVWHRPSPPPTLEHHLRHDEQKEQSISIRRQSLPANYEIPHIGQDKFSEKYASVYKGLLPSSTREYPDPSCGNRPDFFDFFRLPKTERYSSAADEIYFNFCNTILINQMLCEITLQFLSKPK